MNDINEHTHNQEELDHWTEMYNPNSDVYHDNPNNYANQLNSKNDENLDTWNPIGIRVINSADIWISELTDTIGLNPNDAENYFKRASFYEIRGKQDKAIADYSETIRLKPDYTDAYLRRSVCYKKMGLKDEAIIDYNNVIRLNSDYASCAVLYGFITKTFVVDII